MDKNKHAFRITPTTICLDFSTGTTNEESDNSHNEHQVQTLECVEDSTSNQDITSVDTNKIDAECAPNMLNNATDAAVFPTTSKCITETNSTLKHAEYAASDGEEPIECSKIRKLSHTINQIFEKRLKEIDTVANGNKNLKLETYQEWVATLIEMNESILNNTQDLECNEATILMDAKGRSQTQDEADKSLDEKYCRDIAKLITIYRHARETGVWNFDVNFETITKEKILGERVNEQI